MLVWLRSPFVELGFYTRQVHFWTEVIHSPDQSKTKAVNSIARSKLGLVVPTESTTTTCPQLVEL